MPRQQINDGREIWTPSGKNLDGSTAYIVRPYQHNMQGGDGDELHELPTVSVGWYSTAPGGLAQPKQIDIVIEVEMQWMAVYVDAWRAENDDALDIDGKPVPKDGWAGRGVIHAHLRDRREANELIRVVRRARDKVWEPDE